MLAKKNPTLERAYEQLIIASKDERARMIYEAREKHLMDERSREYAAGEGRRIAIEKAAKEALKRGLEQGMEKGLEQGMEKGMEKGIEQARKEFAAKNRVAILRLYAKGLSAADSAEALELPESEVEQILTDEKIGFR